MKNLKYIICFILLGGSLFSCNDEYLEKYPLDSITNEKFWNAEKDLRAYSFGFYGEFDGKVAWDDDNSDNNAPNNINSTATSRRTVDKGTWSWSYLRKCNFFIENHDRSESLDQGVKDKYKGIAQFFRAMYVYDRIKTYGDIPFTTKVLTTEDKDIIYGPRVDRKIVMEQVLKDLTDATQLIPEKTSIEGEITKWAALALKARICLHEGTFRKYHGIDGSELFLKEAAAAAKKIMEDGGFEIYKTGKPNEDYNKLFTQISLKGNKEAILYEVFDGETKGHSFIRYLPGPTNNGLTKDMVNDYLCDDGLPIGLSPKYKGDATFKDEFSNRDPRLLQTIVGIDTGYFAAQGQKDDITPLLSIAEGSNTVVTSTTGYHFKKFYDDDEAEKESNGETDMFLFRYAETLLIYAEAQAELGKADQTVINETINQLRERVGMPNMVITNLQEDPDTDMNSAAGYGVDVSVLIQEIRRERRIELACEGFRHDDLMRWKAGKFLEKKALGAKWSAFLDMKDINGKDLYKQSMVGDIVFLDAKGHLDIYPSLSSRAFDPNKDYYYSIPLEEITLNPQLKQNPGWE